MGDMADDLFDQYEDFDGDGDDIIEGIVCKRCDDDGLHWEEVNDTWRLFDVKGRPHICHALDGFEVEE